MSVVVDASVLVAALVDAGADGTWAEEILASASLHAPELARAEAMNILRRLERAQKISTAEVNAAYEDLMELDLEPLPFEPFAARIWELRNTLTSYDGWYVAAAEALDVPLATLDAALARASGPICKFRIPPEQQRRLAAALCIGIAKNHTFNDGNKRTALLATRAFIYLNGYTLEPRQDDEVATLIAVAAGSLDQDELEFWLTRNST